MTKHMKISAFLTSNLLGGLAWWAGSGLMSRIAHWPRISYGQGICFQAIVHVLVYSTLLGLSAVIDSGEKD